MGDELSGPLYESLFLTQEDLPGVSMGESVHRSEGDADDKEWRYCEGIRSGFNVWQKIAGNDLVRHVDIRSLFPSGSRARRYHRMAMSRNAEKLPGATERPGVGEGARAFSGTDPLGLGSKMHIVLFSVGPVVAKVFASGVEFSEAVEIAKKAERRIRDGLATHPPPPAPSEPPRNSERWPRGEVEYEDKLAGKSLVAGTGVEGVLTFKDTTKMMYETIGGGDENPGKPFVYQFTRGSFAFHVQGRYSRETRLFDVVKIVYEDDPYSQLRTKEGITIGSAEADVLAAMGKPDAPPKPRDGWLWYKRGAAFAITAGRVDAIELFPAVT